LLAGLDGNPAQSSFNTWLAASGYTSMNVTNVNSKSEIAAVNFSNFKLIFIPSSNDQTVGGISDANNGFLIKRRRDLITYVNTQGGSLVSLTQVCAAKYMPAHLPHTCP
jgi:hypothetical protein